MRGVAHAVVCDERADDLLPWPFEVIVVTSSTDGTADVVRHYLAADDRGHAASALDLVLGAALDRCTTRYFSLGNSTRYGGRVFKEGQFRFKSRFGAGSVVFEAYDLPLS